LKDDSRLWCEQNVQDTGKNHKTMSELIVNRGWVWSKGWGGRRKSKDPRPPGPTPKVFVHQRSGEKWGGWGNWKVDKVFFWDQPSMRETVGEEKCWTQMINCKRGGRNGGKVKKGETLGGCLFGPVGCQCNLKTKEKGGTFYFCQRGGQPMHPSGVESLWKQQGAYRKKK